MTPPPQPEYIPMKRKLASSLVQELDDHWLVMMEVNKEPMTLEFVKIIEDHSSIQSSRDRVLDEVILEMVYSEQGFPKTVKEFSERITSLHQKAGSP